MANTQIKTTITSPINFLGCSVTNFTSSLGWGVDNSSFSVELVEDCYAGDRFWGKDEELIGTARYFDLSAWGSNYYFGGIVSSWKQSRGSGGEKFSVQMEDAKNLLSGVTIVCDSYSYAPVMEYNYYNVFAKWEGLVHLGNCADFGAAQSDKRGMNYNKIVAGLLGIAGQNQGDAFQRPACYSPTLPVASNGAVFKVNLGLLYNTSTGQFTQTRADSLPLGPSYYKIAGGITLLDLINNICELTGRNFYTSLSYDPATNTGIINVHCIHLVDTYAGNYSTIVNAFNGTATELSYGKEFNNTKSRNIVFGDNTSYVNSTSDFTFYFGDYTVDFPNTPIVPKVNAQKEWLDPLGNVSDCGFWFYPELYMLNASLYSPLGVNYAWISEADLQAASASFAMWLTRSTLAVDDGNGNKVLDLTKNPVGSLGYVLCSAYPQLLNLTGSILTELLLLHKNNPNIPIGDIVNNINGGQQLAFASEQLTMDLEAIYSFVKNFADNFYGRKYLFKINEQICYHYADLGDTNSKGELVFSAEPTNEGGWVEYGSVLLGLADPYLAFFRSDDGRVNSFALWGGGPAVGDSDYNGLLDLKDMSEQDFICDGSNVWIRGTIGEKLYSVYDARIAANVPSAVMEFSSPSFVRADESYIAGDQAEQILQCLYLLAFNSQLGGADPNGRREIYQLDYVFIQEYGSGYAVGDAVTFGGTTSGEVAVVDGDGGVTAIRINNGFVDSDGDRPFFISSANGSGASGYALVSQQSRSKFCGLPADYPIGAGQAQNRVGYTDLNKLGLMRRALLPNSAIIPMKSNVVIYGPYFSANFLTSYGGVNVEQDTGLVPWNFGSLFTMAVAGQARANTNFDGEEPLFISENGNVVVPGLPEYSLGGQLFYNGVYAGPLVNNVNVSFGSQGITTAYDFKTFTRKFGGLTAIQTEQIKLVNQNRQTQLKYVRDNLTKANQVYKKSVTLRTGSTARFGSTDRDLAASRSNTTNRIIVAEKYKWGEIVRDSVSTSGERTAVAFETLEKLGAEAGREYASKAAMSLDGLFSPVSVSGDGNLPRYGSYEMDGINPGVARVAQNSLSTNPPIKVSGEFINNKEITHRFLNPLQNPFSANDHYSKSDGVGHSIDVVAREDAVLDKGMMTSLYQNGDPEKYSEDYRFVGMKGPIVLHAWGYDTEGRPIPNIADTEADQGTFKAPNADGLKDEFVDDWLQKPSTWPVGPIDLRYDRSRGVWVSPPEYAAIEVRSIASMSRTKTECSGVAVNQNDSYQYGPDFRNESGGEIELRHDSSDPTFGGVDIKTREGPIMVSGDKGLGMWNAYSQSYTTMPYTTKLRIGKFTGPWDKGDTKSIAYVVPDRQSADPTPPPSGSNSVMIGNVYNMFGDIAATGEGLNCVFFETEGHFYLLAAECP